MTSRLQTAVFSQNIDKQNLLSYNSKSCNLDYEWGEIVDGTIGMNGSYHPPWDINCLRENRKWNNPAKDLPQPAPNFWNMISSRLAPDGEKAYACQHAFQECPFWHQRMPCFGESMSSNVFANLQRCFNCIGNSFLDPWGEKQAFTAHVGWENG